MDGWRDLANAIIETAAHDYKQALRTLERYPYNYMAQRQKYEIEQFFRGSLFEVLTDIDGNYLMKKLQEEVHSDYRIHRMRKKK